MQLLKLVTKSKRRVGRGHGTGRVKTAGRGTKGQKAREGVRIGYEGGQLPLIKRLPFIRGKDRNKSQKIKTLTLSLERLKAFKDGSKVNLEGLKKMGIIDTNIYGVKLVGNKTELPNKLQVELASSQGAKKLIEKYGGNVLLPNTQ